MGKGILVYYPFTVQSNGTSASKLRPLEMLHAFREWAEKENLQVYFISGSSKEREQQFQQLKQEGKLEELLFCYVENQTIPLWLTDPNHVPQRPFIDHEVFQYLKKNGVPIGVFYRDVYWKFPDLYPLRGIKRKIMQTIYRLEEKFYEKYADVLFVPSQEMTQYIDIDLPKVVLPPGGKTYDIPEKKITKVNKGIYVGGIRHDTGINNLIDAMEIIKEKGILFDLTIVCRKNEFESLSDELKRKISRLNIDVRHLSGTELHQLYVEMHVGFIPFKRTVYNDFAVAYKLFEYLSFQLPVIATDCVEQKRLIESGPYGIVCEDHAYSIAGAIEQMMEHYDRYYEQIRSAFLKQHSWYARVETVKKSLLGES